jgi:hypothetical protein
MAYDAGTYNDNCDISNDITEPILNPALDPSDCFITTPRITTTRTCGNLAGNLSTNFYFSNNDLLEDVQTNLMIRRLNNTNRPVCQQAQRPVFKTQKERLRYLKYYRERSLAGMFFESITNS